MLIISKKKIIISFFIIVLIVLLILIFKGKKEPSYDFVLVQKGDIIEQISATGTVKPVHEVDLRFESSGTVEKIYVSEGQQIKQGAYLIKLYTGKLNSQFLQAQASYNQAKAELEQYRAGATEEEIRVAEQEVETA